MKKGEKKGIEEFDTASFFTISKLHSFTHTCKPTFTHDQCK